MHFWLLHTEYCALARWFCISRKGGTEGGGWDHLQGIVHMATAGTKWANSHPHCMKRALRGYLPTKNADYCMLINEWVWLRSQVSLLELKVHLDSVCLS